MEGRIMEDLDGRSPYMIKVTEVNEMFKKFQKEMKERIETIRSELALSLLKQDGKFRKEVLK